MPDPRHCHGRYGRALFGLDEILQRLCRAIGWCFFAMRAAAVLLLREQQLRAGEAVSPEQGGDQRHRHDRSEDCTHSDVYYTTISDRLLRGEGVGQMRTVSSCKFARRLFLLFTELYRQSD